MKIEPFTDSLLASASRLLAERHRRERLERPELPARFEQPVHAQKALSALLEKPHKIALAAVRSEALIGYLVGSLAHTELRGRHVWIDYAGGAIAADETVEV